MATMKKIQLLMLPTNEKAPIRKLQGSNELQYFDTPVLKYGDLAQTQHLYFLSDEEIKEGDWQYTKLHGVTKANNLLWSKQENAKKVLATTDTLSLNYDLHKDSIYLPQPSPSFLEVYVTEYNKGNQIKEVMVEYEERQLFDLHTPQYERVVEELKVNPKDNTITIKKVKESWSRDELIIILNKFGNKVYGDYTRNETMEDFIDKWIEQNL
jgi:hypothetical protein